MTSARSDSSACPMPSPLTAYSSAGHVAVLVVEDRADDALGKLELDVAELLARLVPGFALVRLRGAALHAERHAAVALAREGDHLLEVVELLELLLHAVEHLVLDLLRRGARPDRPWPSSTAPRSSGSSSWPSLVKLSVPPTPITRIRNSTMARWFSAHSVRLKDFIGRPASMASLRAASGSATRNPGAIFCTPAVTMSAPGGGPETSTSSLRYPCTVTRIRSTVPTGSLPARTHHPQRRLPIALRDRAGRDRRHRRVCRRVLGDQRGRRAERQALWARWASSRARYVRVCAAACGDSSRSTTSNVVVGRARQRGLEARLLERPRADPRARRRRSRARPRPRSRRPAGLRRRPGRPRTSWT